MKSRGQGRLRPPMSETSGGFQGVAAGGGVRGPKHQDHCLPHSVKELFPH